MSKSIVPTTIPTIDTNLAWALGKGWIMTDPYILDQQRLISGVVLVVIRDVVVGRYNDTFILYDNGVELGRWYGNADPGLTGLNKLLGLDYARLCEGVWIEVPGRHKTQAEAFVQARIAKAAEVGLPELFDPEDPDKRFLGYCAINRMKSPTEPGPRRVGRFGINLHRGRDTRTGSAGCLTLAEVHYNPFYKLATTAMRAKTPRQRFLTVVVGRGPIA